ncbi:MAG: NAD kinase [Bacteroidales bacterium]|nr:NAD kinase [Bacteroidales bacterium]
MNIAIFGKTLPDLYLEYVRDLIQKLEYVNCKLYIYEPYFELLKNKLNFNTKVELFKSHHDLVNNVDYLFSIGGDGTLLDTITLVRDSGIPILGINLGKLGFLSSISKEEISQAIDGIIAGKFTLEKRALLRLQAPTHLFGDLNYALNELTVYKKAPSSMITIHASVNDNYLNSYWADGLIVATPTGSTGYSLSCGGPIISPGSGNFIINPIAIHNLSVRPIVIPDNSVIKIRAEGRDDSFFVSLDSRSAIIDSSTELIIVKEKFHINLIQMENENFFKTIRDKLMWGKDIRN